MFEQDVRTPVPMLTQRPAFCAVVTLDVIGNGAHHALTDGLIMIRALFGLTGTAATNNAIGADAARPDWASIRTFLNGNCGTHFSP